MFDSHILTVKDDPSICGQPQRGSATVQAAGEAQSASPEPTNKANIA